MVIGIVITLALGFPIGLSIGASSAASILVILPFDQAMITAAQRFFYRREFLLPAGNSLLCAGRQHYE